MFMFGPFRGVLIPDLLTETKDTLIEGSPFRPLPSSVTITANSAGTDEEGSVLKKPGRDRVVDWDPAIKTIFQA